MRIINGKMYFIRSEVAEMVGRTSQTIHLWDKWSDELEARGEERLIPAPIRIGGAEDEKFKYRYWSAEDVEKIKEFADNIKYGDLREFTNRRNNAEI